MLLTSTFIKSFIAQLALLGISNINVYDSNPLSLNYQIITQKVDT